jgi:single-stranded DNA-specific DHH superfamily exonuclease
MAESGCDPQSVSASSIGFMLAPRINAAGRMGKIELALELFLTEDPERASYLANALCELNRQRQSVEAQIYQEAVSMLPEGKTPAAIVLADEDEYNRKAAADFVATVYKNNTKGLISALYSDGILSEEDIADLRREIENADK